MLKKEPPKKEQTREKLFESLHQQAVDLEKAEKIFSRLAETHWDKTREFSSKQEYVKKMLDAYRVYRLKH